MTSLRHRALAGVALALALLSGPSLVASSAAHAEEGVDAIAAGPATATGPDPTRSRFSYQLDPGQQVTDEFLVSNPGTTQQAITIYATDAFTDDEGTYSLLDTGEPAQDVGRWVQFGGGQTSLSLILQPGEQQILPFTMAVPADARPGDHAGGLVVSAVTPGAEVSVDRRVATRLYARVKGELQAALTITSITASYAPELNPFAGRTTISYTITNGGNVSLGADVVSRVRGLFGIPIGELDSADLPEMLPGDTRTVTAEVDGVGQWLYLTPEVDLAATVDEDALDAGPLPTAARETVIFVVPWGLIAALVIAAIVWLVVRWNRSRNDKRAKAWLEYNEAEAQRKAQDQLARDNESDSTADDRGAATPAGTTS